MENKSKRPFKLSKDEDINAVNLEKMFDHYDEKFRDFNLKAADKVDKLPNTATTDEQLAKLNEIIEVLKNAGLMNT